MQVSTAQSPIIAVTNHGPHSAETWGVMFAKTMMPIDPNIDDHKRGAAERFQATVAKALIPVLNLLIDTERMHLCGSTLRFADPLDGHCFVNRALADLYKATDYSMWGDYVRKFDDFLRFELTRHLNHVQHVERLWHADNNKSEAGSKYRLDHSQG